MSKVLYVTANPKPVAESYSLSVGSEFLKAYREANPNDEIIEIDVYKTDIPQLDADVFSGWGKLQSGKGFDELSASEKVKVGRLNQLVDEFVSADKYIFVSPLWNLSIPPLLKAYIDSVFVAGKTFQYTENGPVGLLKNKKAIHIQASGGVYSEGPAANFELGNRYVKTAMTFLGVTSIESIMVEGMGQEPAEADKIRQQKIEEAKQLAKSF